MFTERLPWISPYRRRTQRLENALREVAFSTNAAQAEKVCRTLGIPVSHDSLLRLIYKTPLPKKESPLVLMILHLNDATDMELSFAMR